MSINPFDHPFLSKLLGDEEMAEYFSVEQDIDAMLRFELALARSSASLGLIPLEANLIIQDKLAGFYPDVEALNQSVADDGVVIPSLIAQMRAVVPQDVRVNLHFGATSQDVIDSSLVIRLTKVLMLAEQRLKSVINAIELLEAKFGSNILMGHTRMQAALNIKASDRLNAWKAPLVGYAAQLERMIADGLPIQFGGAVGTLEKFSDQGTKLRALLAKDLGLADHAQWHSQRETVTDIAHLLAKISASLGKIGQDIALLAQSGGEIAMSGGGASSAMPHKQNPVLAEVLVSQARFTTTLVGGLYHSMVHEQERSGAAWTLEWMLLPQIALSCGASTLCAHKLLSSITRVGRHD
jgi:3-carboxy-cis,cis-muconate cycloisomerase